MNRRTVPFQFMVVLIASLLPDQFSGTAGADVRAGINKRPFSSGDLPESRQKQVF